MTPVIGITADFDSSGPRAPHSFLYADYYEAVRRFGGLPLIIPPYRDAADLDSLVDRLDGIIFSGGDDLHPRHYGQPLIPQITLLEERREKFELTLARRLLEGRDTPLLGICNGIQLLNVAAGGTLVAHLEAGAPELMLHKVPRPAQAYHQVHLDPGSRLSRITGASVIRTNSFHHQSIAEPGDGVSIVGRSADGVVEAIELPAHDWAMGVQWHPEKEIGDPCSARLLVDFLEAAS